MQSLRASFGRADRRRQKICMPPVLGFSQLFAEVRQFLGGPEVVRELSQGAAGRKPGHAYHNDLAVFNV
jgi:hypothetical protein